MANKKMYAVDVDLLTKKQLEDGLECAEFCSDDIVYEVVAIGRIKDANQSMVPLAKK